MSRLKHFSSGIIHRISSNKSEGAGFYRFLSNKRVTMEELLHEGLAPMVEKVSGREVLVIGDTVELSLKARKGKIRDLENLGVVSNNRDPGFHSHVSLVLDQTTGHGLGLSDVLIWNRQINKIPKKERTTSQPLREDQKESMKWLMGASNSKEILNKALHKTFVFDAEGDNYRVWQQVPDASSDLIVRARVDRHIKEGEAKLYGFIDQQEIAGTFDLSVRANPDKNRKKRKAKLAVKFGTVTILPPKDMKQAHPLNVSYVEAKETDQSLPEGETPIHWRLLTSLQITDLSQACQILDYYGLRWMIEQLFRVLKRQGFNLEQTELEYALAIKKMYILSLFAAQKVMQMLLARDQKEGQPLTEIFSSQEQACLQLLNDKYQGKTQKQKNPYPPEQLAWASWVIARLGGWKGYQKARPPGPITMKRGLDKFYIMFETWTLLQN